MKKIVLRPSGPNEYQAVVPIEDAFDDLPDKLYYRVRKSGYSLVMELTAEDEESTPLTALSGSEMHYRDLLEHVRMIAASALRRERIFDWRKWEDGTKGLDPDTEAAVQVMSAAEHLEKLLSIGAYDDAISCAIWLGAMNEQLAAQIAWKRRNPPPSANATRKAKAQARQEMLADYIQNQGERPEKRPGQWYDGFRELYPQHAARDKTLKADYPHALKMSRKATGGKGA